MCGLVFQGGEREEREERERESKTVRGPQGKSGGIDKEVFVVCLPYWERERERRRERERGEGKKRRGDRTKETLAYNTKGEKEK